MIIENSVLTLNWHKDWVRCLIQLHDGRIASGGLDKTVKLWDIKRINNE